MQVSIKIDVPTSKNRPAEVWGQRIDGLSGTRNHQDFQGERLGLDRATTEQGATIEIPDGALFVVVVQRSKDHRCDLRVLFRADGTSGEASLDPSEQTQIVVRGASVVVAARPESKWGASWEPILAVLEETFPVTRKRKPRSETRQPGLEGHPNMGPVQYRCPLCDCAIERSTGSGHAPGCTFRA